ncbi:unnamed protein product [Phaedon cochleariae]|uniref:Farnesyl pyrophosphate synthase n=1 Tax=Phaedon cochleariae TaxID=80249 RepID=A0A9N9WZV4_PHACE|nr:unnamed protein product [Phaedon cochleariae]
MNYSDSICIKVVIVPLLFNLRLRSFALIADDIMDNSEIRRNAPCWYRTEGVGNNAMLDLVVLENSVYSVLKKYFSDHHSYVQIVELFHDASTKSAMGKSLEGMLRKSGSPDLNQFTMKNYDLIVKYRSGFFSFQLPVGKDFLNCFGTSGVDDKVGSDINEGKCSWLAVVALQRANDEQRQIMEQYYGKPGEKAVEKIRDFYTELGLPATFAGYEEENYKIITTHIQQISKGLPHELFFGLLNKMYQYNR